MTQVSPSPSPPEGGWSPRDSVDLVVDQLGAIDRWNGSRRMAEQASELAARTREARLDHSRRMEVLRRQHDALLARTAQQLADSARVLRTTAPRRAVLVHRDEWFRGRVAAALVARGVDVVSELDNGADAVGCVVAEQPDLLLVEDRLPMLSGEQVLAEVRAYSPSTRCGAAVEHDGRGAALLSAGAAAVWSRRVPPVDVALGLGRLVGV
jgi:CheY-like chemotaxis protein